MSVVLVVFMVCLEADSGFDYKKWWNDWYSANNGSGGGSRGVLAQFKADVINGFIEKNNVVSTVEFGCGDGYNLKMIQYKRYVGFDVSSVVIDKCKVMFKDDKTKSFYVYTPQSFVKNANDHVDLVVCLDVLYHVVNEEEYVKLLDDIFSYSSPYVILYTSLRARPFVPESPEILHRDVFLYLEKYKNYEAEIIVQRYQKESGSDFIILRKK